MLSRFFQIDFQLGLAQRVVIVGEALGELPRGTPVDAYILPLGVPELSNAR